MAKKLYKLNDILALDKNTKDELTQGVFADKGRILGGYNSLADSNIDRSRELIREDHQEYAALKAQRGEQLEFIDSILD